MTTRIALLDEHRMLRDAVGELVASEPGLEVIGAVGAVREVEAMLDRTDVVLLAMDIPGGGALELVTRLRARGRVRTIVVSTHADPEYVRAALAAGAGGYVFKTSPGDCLIEAIRQVVGGGTYLDPSMQIADVDTPAAAGSQNLTNRERAVLVGIAHGQTYKQISAHLGIGRRTVETYRRRITTKLGLRRRADLVRFAVELGWMNTIARS